MFIIIHFLLGQVNTYRIILKLMDVLTLCPEVSVFFVERTQQSSRFTKILIILHQKTHKPKSTSSTTQGRFIWCKPTGAPGLNTHETFRANEGQVCPEHGGEIKQRHEVGGWNQSTWQPKISKPQHKDITKAHVTGKTGTQVRSDWQFLKLRVFIGSCQSYPDLHSNGLC